MNRQARFVHLVLVVVFILSFANADGRPFTRRVPEDYATIEAALAVAFSRDTVDVAAGTYYEHDLVWPPRVSIVGRAGDPALVIIDAQEQGRVLWGEDLVDENVLAYVTLRRGNSPYGGGVKAEGDPVIHDVIIEHCINSYRGVGLDLIGGAVIENCIFRYNQSDIETSSGGGAWLDCYGAEHAFYLNNVEVYGNRAHSGSGLYANTFYGSFENLSVHDNDGIGLVAYEGHLGHTGPYIENSVFYNNTGSGIAFDADVVIRNCTLVGNGTVGNNWYGALLCWSTWEYQHNPVISECLIAYNNGPGIRWHDYTPHTIECNNVFGNKSYNYLNIPDYTGTNGNISKDPQFCDKQSEGVYGIETGSPCAPDNNECGALMGAFPVSCEDTATESISWSRIKSLY